jgi:nucleotide-binding universal stress UspA family protein
MKNILVPVDLSAITARTITYATQLARPMGAKLWLVHVAAPDPDFVGFEPGPQYVRENRADELKKEHQEIQDRAEALRADGVDAEGLLVQGATSATIIEEAARLKADLIVMGSHGHGALYKTFMGSVSQQVLGDSTIPVLIIPAREHA